MENENKDMKYVLKTALAFGGINAALIFKAFDENYPKL
jgi:3-oxoacyl-(acyl-carrier-protein) synthase